MIMKHPTHAVPVRSQDFRLLVVQKLAFLETLMIELAGNGQPGRIQRLEDKVRHHERLIWLMTGAGAVVGWLLQQVFG